MNDLSESEDLADPRVRLAVLISEISEYWYCAGWMMGIEHQVWRVAHGQARPGGEAIQLDDAQRRELLALSREIGGWVRWVDGGPGESGAQFIALESWLQLHAEHER